MLVRTMIAVWSLALAATASGAIDTPAASEDVTPPQNPTLELAEIRVHGERIVQRINEAEDRFFKLYNTLNTRDDYRMTCGYRSLMPGSMILTRTCVPGFVADYGYVGAPQTNPGLCAGGGYADGNVPYVTATPCIDGGYEPPPLGLLVMARSEDLRRHMMKVIRSDERLGDMAGHLDNLYHEMDSLQNRYVAIQKANRKPGRGTIGPRAARM